MTDIVEGMFTCKDGLKIYTKEWKVVSLEGPTAAIVFLHGFSDHINAYYDFFPDLVRKGIEVYGFDQRGWGKSALDKKQWGVTGPTSAVFTDLDEILTARLAYLQTLPSRPPLFLVGHSAGGGICLAYAGSGSLRSKLAGFVAFSPWIRLSPVTQPNPIRLSVGKLAANVLPNHQLVSQPDPTAMARDPEVCRLFTEDKLCHDTGTLLSFSEAFERAKKLLRKDFVRGFDAKKPVLVLHGSADRVTDCNGTKEFYGLLEVEDKEFKEYDGWYHKMHADLPENRGEFSSYIADWILARVDTAKKGDLPTANL